MADKLPLSIKELDFDLLKGKSRRITITYGPKGGAGYDLTGWKARFKAKERAGDDIAIINLTETDGITLSSGTNNIQIIIPGTPTADLALSEIRYGFELEDIDTVVTPLLTGDISLITSVV